MTHSITCRQWLATDLSNLLSYLLHLNEETQNRFGPHPFTKEALEYLYHHPDYRGFIIIETNSTFIIGYAIVKLGYLEHDSTRLSSYDLQLNQHTDATFAPSLADEWQGKGLGKLLWNTVKSFLISEGVDRVILWGGVQETNQRAFSYYQQNGFREVGRYFFHEKINIDMVCLL